MDIMLLRLVRIWRLRKCFNLPSTIHLQTDYIPEQIYERIFQYLSGEGIKQCRLVCKAFEKIATTFLDETTCIIFDGDVAFTQVGFSKRKARRLIRYLSESDVKFSFWSTMRIRHCTESQLKALLEESVPRFVNTLQNVATVELIRCSLTWSTVIKFLHLFKNLEQLIDKNNNYLPMPDPTFYCCRAIFDPAERTLIDIFDHKVYPKKLSFHCVEPASDIILMLRVLEVTCSNVEDFELSISSDKEIFTFERSEFSNNLGLFILKQLPTLKKLTFKWTAVNYHYMFEDFFRVIPVLNTTHHEIIITELILDFDWIFLGHLSFEQELIPFVRRLKSLKHFTLMKVILQAGLGHLIEELQPPPPCQFHLGILVSDHPNLDEAAVNLEILQTEVFTSSMTALRVAIDLSETSTASQVIPLGQQQHSFPLFGDDFMYRSMAKFLNARELMIKHLWNGTSTRFVSYNINGIVLSFPNLTELCIFDGPKFEYLGTFRIRRQWDYMSEAAIMDHDFQLILKNLTKLKVLRIRAYLEHLTDCGLTGLFDQVRDSYDSILGGSGSKTPKIGNVGFAVSALQDLEEFVIKGVGDGITDASAFFAFQGLKKLDILAICGSTKLTKSAKDFLRQAGYCSGSRIPRCELT